MLNKDYKEMLQLLLEEQVDFILVGAYALTLQRNFLFAPIDLI